MRGAVASAVILALAAFGSLWFGLVLVDSPLVAGPRPFGVTDHALQQATFRAFTACAANGALSPPGCPQSAPSDSVTARWILVGDPTFGSVVEYRGGGRFDVYGTFAMVLVRFTGDDQAALAVEGLYMAYLHVAGVQEVVDKVAASGFLGTDQRPANATDSAARAAALAALKSCTTSAPSVALCPRPNGTAQPLRFSGDPTKSATVTYDSTFGIVHVKGTLATASGTTGYDAHVAVTPNGLQAFYVSFQ